MEASRADDGAERELERLLARIPEGWTRVEVDGRAYGLTCTTHTGGRSVSVLAEELAGTDVVSTNVWRLGAGLELRPCEMPVEKVLSFLRAWTPAARGRSAWNGAHNGGSRTNRG